MIIKISDAEYDKIKKELLDLKKYPFLKKISVNKIVGASPKNLKKLNI